MDKDFNLLIHSLSGTMRTNRNLSLDTLGLKDLSLIILRKNFFLDIAFRASFRSFLFILNKVSIN